jgi:hypothetical protein
LIRGLESYLDIELFHRSTSGPSRLTLTDAGRSALPDLQAGSTCFPPASNDYAPTNPASSSR